MLDEFFITLSRITPAIVVILIPTLLYFKDRKKFLTYVLSLAVTLAIVYFLKYLFQVPRPSGSVIGTLSPRFPSAHAAITFLLVGYFKKTRYRLPLLFFAILVTYSRIYLRVHLAVDLLVGSLIGFLIPYLILYREEMISDRFPLDI